MTARRPIPVVVPVIVPQAAGRSRMQARHLTSGQFAAPPPPVARTRRARGGTVTIAAAARLRRPTG
jgi:hypothetical protein